MNTTKPQKPARDTRTPYGRAFDEWWEREGKKASRVANLGTERPDYFLANRLANAFRAGYNAKP